MTNDEGRKRFSVLRRWSLVVGRSSFVAEPAHDRVAGEVDHAAAVMLDLGNQRGVDLIELACEFLGATPVPQRAIEPFGQRCEAGDVGEQRGATGMFREIGT